MADIPISVAGLTVWVPDTFRSLDPAAQKTYVEGIKTSEQFKSHLANPNPNDPLAPPTPEIAAARVAVAPKPVVEPQHEGNLLEQVGSGFGQFGATMLGLPSDALEGLVNTPATLVDIARHGGLRDDRPAPGTIDIPMGSDDWQERMRMDTVPGVVGPLIAPEDPDYSVIRRAAELAPSFLLPELGLARFAGKPMGWSQVAKEATSAGTAAGVSAVGGEVGGGVAEDLGLPPELGQIIGEAAGGVTPSLARGAIDKGVKWTFQDGPRSKQVYDAALAQGVEPSFGLVGNQQAAQTENILKATPISGGMVERRIQRQVEGTAASLARTVEPNYNPGGFGTPVLPRAVGDYAIGDRAQTFLRPAEARLSAELGRLQDTMFRQMGGRDQAMPLTAFERWYQQVRPTHDAVGKDLLDQLRADLRRDIINSPGNDIDRALGSRLRGDLQAASNQLAALRRQSRPPAGQVRQLEDEVRQIQDDISANLGIRADNLDMARSRIGAASASGSSLGNLTEGGAKRAVQATMRDRVRTQGGDLRAFNRALDEKRRIASPRTSLRIGSDKPFVEKVLKQEPQATFRYLTTPEGVERLIATQRNMAPEQFETLAADIIQDMAMPTSAGARYGTENFSPAKFAGGWRNMAPEAKRVLFPNPVMRQQLDQVAILAEAEIRRGQAANPSGSASTGIGAATWYGTLANPSKTLPFLAGVAGAGSPLVNNTITKIIAEQYPFFFERLAQGATRSGLATSIGNAGQEQ